MADQFCPSCGTEVEADARFCPSCGTTLGVEGDSEATGADTTLPPAPAWPAADSRAEPEPGTELQAAGAAPAVDQPTMTDRPAHEAEPASEPKPERVTPAQAAATAPPPPVATAGEPHRQPLTPVARSSDFPVTWPTTVAGWLIGAGSLLGAIFLIARLGNIVSLLLFVALLGIAATVFAADWMPEIPRLRLAVLATTMIGLGVALARAGFTVAGVDTLFLLAMLAAGGGALLIELERDRPWPPPPERSRG